MSPKAAAAEQLRPLETAPPEFPFGESFRAGVPVTGGFFCRVLIGPPARVEIRRASFRKGRAEFASRRGFATRPGRSPRLDFEPDSLGGGRAAAKSRGE